MSIDKNDVALDDQFFSSVSRKTPPVSEHLKQKILEGTRHMPQQLATPPATTRPNEKLRNRWFGRRFLPAYGLAVVVLGMTVLFSDILLDQTETTEFSAQEIILTSSDELAWQDVMLMHDELAFIDL